MKITKMKISRVFAIMDYSCVWEITLRRDGCVFKTKDIGCCRNEDTRSILNVKNEDGSRKYQITGWSIDHFESNADEMLELNLVSLT